MFNIVRKKSSNCLLDTPPKEKYYRFDLEKLDDLPATYLKEHIGNIKYELENTSLQFQHHSKMILALFDFKTKLSYGEIVVGLYREFKMEYSQEFLIESLSWLFENGLLKRCNDSLRIERTS